VVSHSGFLRVAVSNRFYANADYRVFDFGEGEDGKLALTERDWTEKRGGGLGESPLEYHGEPADYWVRGQGTLTKKIVGEMGEGVDERPKV
jgi:hypothetical protein